MSNVTAAVPLANLSLRRILHRDLAALMQIEQQPPALRWTEQDLKAVIQTPNTAGWVAEVEGRVVGFLIYVVSLQPQRDELARGESKEQAHWAKWFRPRQPLHVTLLNLAITAEYQRCGLGKLLIGRLNQEFTHPQDRIQATVPESNLSVQCLLREGGYRAVRIFRGYYDSEDGYLMERKRS
jgi:ribosomal protein S18 acetylase RimI-like enzyme